MSRPVHAAGLPKEGSSADAPSQTATEMAGMLRSGQTSSVEITRAVLARADRDDGVLGSYLRRNDEAALEAAAKADRDFAAGVDRGPLQGIPVAIKDLFSTATAQTTAQSRAADPGWGGRSDATVIARLRLGGAVLTGASTLSEFAVGHPDPAAPFPVPRNPWDAGCYSGGSSSGTAIGVAARLFPVGIGTDTGGSIRIPAAMCGVTGLKPTYGRVPRTGCIPLAFSLDHVGPIALTAADCAAALQVIAGCDPADPSSSGEPVPDLLAALTGSVVGLRVAAEPPDEYGERADSATIEAYESALAVMRDLGAVVRPIKLPDYRQTEAANLIISQTESFTWHARALRARWKEYGAVARRRIAAGALISAADYVQAQQVRERTRHRLRTLFQDVDLVVTLTVISGAPRYRSLEHLTLDPVTDIIRTPYWNAVGNPAMALPIGFTSGGLPVSMQLAGRHFDDSLVLRAGDAYQRATEHHTRSPEVTAPAISVTREQNLQRAPQTPVPETATHELVTLLLGRSELSVDGADLAELAAAFDRSRVMAALLS